MSKESSKVVSPPFEDFKQEVINDYRIAVESREASLLGRKEVLTGKAKFGIFGDGKEVAQLAMARSFKLGDFRSGYYRDQTFMFATNNLTIQQWFAGLYAHADVNADPTSGGRQMGGHFATRSLNDDGSWKNLTSIKNSSADISPTAGQMPRLLGLAQASKIYRNVPGLEGFTNFSSNGNEIAFGTIGDASTSEGLFWECINAAGVLQVPLVMCVWDDGHGISVPKKYQTTKESISEALKGFQKESNTNGFEIFKVKGWDYPSLCETFEKATAIAREKHIPILIHVEEITQPQGHSTSGSHERYKSKERLQWEIDFDCIKQMREWMLKNAIASDEELLAIENESKLKVREAKSAAWKAFLDPIKAEINELNGLLDEAISKSQFNASLSELKTSFNTIIDPIRRDIHSTLRKAIRITRNEGIHVNGNLKNWYKQSVNDCNDRYSSHLNSQSNQALQNIHAVPPQYNTESKMVDAREIIRDNFDWILSNRPEVLIFGEDVGRIGDVNQGCERLQEKYGELRVSDVGIREASIMGQGIGMAMRGLRPIAEIQYLDYFLYGLQILSDDLATLQYRTKGGQKAPLIIRTRGHRLEGIWHSGSPMGTIIHALRGVNICVPRNMTQAAGFYNLLLHGDEPGVIVEPLNGYRLKEKMPSNLGEFKTPVGIPEILLAGSDITLVTYGSTCRIASEACDQLEAIGIHVELIDVQTLLPFDVNHTILESVKRTNRLLVVDEDVPGGASAYILQQIVEIQNAYQYLDAKPATLTAKAHRPAYGSDGDYFSKPSVEDVFDAVYNIMHESNPVQFPAIY
ncbi:MAG TPA: thiamine pyrophosphate-dependent enzyme [Bacteroidia bacterium]|nr:thiamine pyrophosphate-dependent enzyme [Bacteroidia bacterium]